VVVSRTLAVRMAAVAAVATASTDAMVVGARQQQRACAAQQLAH